VEQVILDAVNGRRLTMRISSQPEHDIWRFWATLSLPEGEVTAEVWEMGAGLGPYFRDLSNSWQGFVGSRDYYSLEGQLGLSCQHDGRGTVTCRVALSQPAPPEWSMKAVLDFGAGAHLERLADEIESFLPY
jgi:hypothetical protein